MERADAHELGVAFLNAAGAFENPLRAARWWSRAVSDGSGVIGPKPRFDAGLVEELRQLHEASLQLTAAALAGNEPAEHALRTLSSAVSLGRLSLAASSGKPLSLTLAADTGSAAVLLPLARAIAILLAGDLRRLRSCAHGSCTAYFWDTTKNGSRRWCSLACMERVRAPRRRLRR